MQAHSPVMLALDSSGSGLDVAVCDLETGSVISEQCAAGARSHDERLAESVSEVLERSDRSLADCRRIVVGGGPGSFTGIRIGLAFAKGLALANDVPLFVPLSPCGRAYRYCAGSSDLVVVVSKASKDSLYFAAFQSQKWPGPSISPRVVGVSEFWEAEFWASMRQQLGVAARDTRLRLVTADAEVLLPSSMSGKECPLPSEGLPGIDSGKLPEADCAGVAAGLAAAVVRCLSETPQSVELARGVFGANGGGQGFLGAQQLAAVEPHYVRAAEAKTILERMAAKSA